MQSLRLVAALLLPTIALTNKCPAFEAVIPLREGATAHNWSYAVVADGNYHLLRTSRNQILKASPRDDMVAPMPTGFENHSLTVAIDESDCDDRHYYLMAIKSFETQPIQTNYTTLDLINWNNSSLWSEPRPVSEHPMLAQDNALMAMTQFNLIQDKVKTMFYWNLSKSLFVVSEPYTAGSYHYHMINTEGVCNKTFRFFPETSQKFLDLKESLAGSVVRPLDLCYIHNTEMRPILYCFSNFSLHAYMITNDNVDYFTGPLKTMPMFLTGNTPMTVDRLRDIGRLCRKSSDFDLLEQEFNDDYLDFGKVATKAHTSWIQILPAAPKVVDPLKTNEDEEFKDSNDASYTVIIIVVCVLLMVLLIAAIGVTATRKNNQLARM